MINIRKTTAKDIDSLEKLFQLTRQHTFILRNPKEFKIGDYIKSTKEDEVWVAEENNMIVGFVSVYSRDNFIHNLFVHPNHQRKGIGKNLLHIAEQNLTKPIALKVAIDNYKACTFYEKYAYHRVSIHKNTKEPYILYRKI